MSSFVYKKIKATGIKLQIVTTSCWQCLVENITMSKLQKKKQNITVAKLQKNSNQVFEELVVNYLVPFWSSFAMWTSSNLIASSFLRDYLLVKYKRNHVLVIKTKLCVGYYKKWRDKSEIMCAIIKKLERPSQVMF